MADSLPTSLLSTTEITVRYGTQTVLDSATLSINEGEHVGLAGRNGCGKSTFLRIAAGDLQPDAGYVTRRRGLVTGYLPQKFELDESRSVHANILAGAQHVLDLIAEYESLPADSARSGELLHTIEHFDGWNIEHRIKSLISHLHAPDADRLVTGLSGGEKRRVALCRALLARPDFLILDEPTNHLDTDAIEWLEDFLRQYPGACLFVTHDRYFLDRVATRMVELTRGTFISYAGSYNDFLLAKTQRAALEEQQEHRRQKFLKSELEWVRRKPSARRTKSIDRVQRYFEMAAQEAPEQELDVELVIPPAPKLANRVIDLRRVTYEHEGRVLINNLTLDIPAGVRIGIIGRNGIGKTTLLRLILKELQPTHGVVEIGARTEINYIDQNRLRLDENKTVWEEVGEGMEYVRLGEESVTLRGYLRRFLFSEDRINSKISILSGGERSRVVLAKILKRGGNVIILDEPTNDLDLSTLRMLEDALVLFAGTVLLVSHDRYFLNRVCTHILAFEGEGRTFYDAGDYDDYLVKRQKREELPPPSAPAPKSSAPAPRTEKPRKLTFKETRELEGMEASILAVEEEAARIEALFAEPDFHRKHGHETAQLQATLESTRAQVTQLYHRWEELEQIRASGP